ncbi:hypothetical protein [Streptomyces sp. NPDC046805]|uniref:hypothetical protein n=1 Tax=Streptomyces sp. NPDC046805 TaxID=3155134 RepID=UPI0033D4169D
MTSPASLDDRYDEPDQLRDQLRRLLRYRVTLALGIVLGLLGGLLLVQLRTNGYAATSDVLIRTRSDPSFGTSSDNQVAMGTERRMALSAAVAARAAEALHEPSRAGALLTDLCVTNPPNTQVLRFEYTASTAKRAARVSNVFADAYLADRQVRTKTLVTRMTSGLEQQIAGLDKQIAAMDESDSDAKSGTTADQATSAANKAATASLQGQIEALNKRIAEIRSYDTAGGDLVVHRAEPPALPSGPGRVWLIGLGLLIGLLVGIVLAWLRSALDPRARSVGEIQGALGAPVLGLLPRSGKRGELLEVGRSGGTRAEAYRALAFRLRRDEGRTPCGTLLVVAPKRDRRAEAAAVNLAAAFAESGDDVLLVDAASSTRGLATRLPLAAEAADTAGGRVVVDAGKAGRFRLLPDTRAAADGSPEPAMVTRALPGADSGISALVLAPPLLEHADGLAIAPRVDGVLVVGGLKDMRRDDLKRVRELVGCSGGRIVGVVLDGGKRRGRQRRMKSTGLATRPVASLQHADGTAQEELGRPQDDSLTASR